MVRHLSDLLVDDLQVVGLVVRVANVDLDGRLRDERAAIAVRRPIVLVQLLQLAGQQLVAVVAAVHIGRRMVLWRCGEMVFVWLLQREL